MQAVGGRAWPWPWPSGRPAAAYAVALLDERRLVVRVKGNDPARYQIERTP